MPRNPVTYLITDQEIAFAHLILSGTVTDRKAAKAAGLNPDTAAYTKAKPRVQAYMHERRAAMNAQMADQQTEGQRRQQVGREQVLARLWEIANLNPEATRNSASAQIKALSLIIALEGLIPDRHARATEKQPKTPPVTEDFYRSEWFREKQKSEAQPTQDVAQEEAKPHVPDTAPDAAPSEPTAATHPAPDDLIDARPVSRAETPPWVPEAFQSSATSEPSLPFPFRKNPFVRR